VVRFNYRITLFYRKDTDDSEFKPQHGFGLTKTWSQEILNKLQNSNIKGNENTHVQPYQHRQFDEKART
jgi:hypothetical protein